MNYGPTLRRVGKPGTWLVRRFRLAAEGIGDEVTHRPAPATTEADQSGEDVKQAAASPDADNDAVQAAESDAVRDQDEDATDALRPIGRKRYRVNVIRCAAIGALVVALVGSGYEGWLLFQHHQKEVAAAQALDAAKKYILTLTSVDTNAIDKSFTDALDGSTGDFKDMYTKSSAQLRQTLIDNKAAAHGSVIDAAVQSATEDKVDVVLFVDQSVSNGAAPAPQLDRSRVRMTMEKVDGRWLASKVELP